MAALVIEHEPCYIYHIRSFRETSLILEVLSLNYGPLHVMARGAKRANSPVQGIFQPFVPLKLSMRQGRKEDGLFYLSDYEFCTEGYNFKMPDYFCGMYVNELLHHLLNAKERDLTLFASYVSTLEAIAQRDHIENHLRIFELNLLESLGYGLSACDDEGAALQPKEHYRFCFGLGFLPVPASLLQAQQRAASAAAAAAAAAAKAKTTAALATSPAASAEDAPQVAAATATAATTTTDTGAQETTSEPEAADSGLLFAKSKVRGRKMSDSPRNTMGHMGFVPWWEDQQRSGNIERGARELAQKLELHGHDLMGPVLLGSEIADIVNQRFKLKTSLVSAKHLTGCIIERLLHGREIESRRLYREYRELLASRAHQAAIAHAGVDMTVSPQQPVQPEQPAPEQPALEQAQAQSQADTAVKPHPVAS